MKWILFSLILLLARISQLCLLYFCESPMGGPFAKNVGMHLLNTIILEIGIIALWSSLLAAISIHDTRKKNILNIFALCCGGIYLFFSAGNDELLRWMSQHLTLSFLLTYFQAFSDIDLVQKIFTEGRDHFIAELASVAIGCAVLACPLFLIKNSGPSKKFTRILLPSLSIVFLIVSTLSIQVIKGPKFYKRIAPFTTHFANELLYNFSHYGKPDNYEEGIKFLGGDPSKKFPFFHEVENSRLNLENFKNKPLDDKPDIILLTIESLRSWVANPKNSNVCSYMPNFCALADSGAYFPRAFSVGFPSIEGFLGINAGIWAHPEKTLLSESQGSRFTTLPEILKAAGYYRVILSAVDPKFDNMQSWMLQWFDYERHSIKPQNDEEMAKAFIEAYKSRPKDKPIFLNWLSISTHTPFVIPEKFLETHQNLPEEKYERTLAYFDVALGKILETIRNDSRGKNTLIILTGDHAYPTKSMNKQYKHSVHAGYVWVPMVIKGPKVAPGVVNGHPISQVDIAPTILDIIDSKVSNSFVGTNLFKKDKKTAFAFRQGDISVFSDSLVYYTQLEDESIIVETEKTKIIKKDFLVNQFVGGFSVSGDFSRESAQIRNAAKVWQWILDNNLLHPTNYTDY